MERGEEDGDGDERGRGIIRGEDGLGLFSVVIVIVIVVVIASAAAAAADDPGTVSEWLPLGVFAGAAVSVGPMACVVPSWKHDVHVGGGQAHFCVDMVLLLDHEVPWMVNGYVVG